MLCGMRTWWRHFGRKPQVTAAVPPDDAVTGPRTWLMVVVIVATTAALLGTSDNSPSSLDSTPSSQFNITYTFERKGIEVGSFDLTAEQPRTTFYVNFRADDLFDKDVVSTNGASATFRAAITDAGFSTKETPPYLMFKLNTAGMGSGTQTQALDQYTQSTPLAFTGNCMAPTEGQVCSTTLALEISRTDDGSHGGTVHVDLLLDVNATSMVPDTENGMIGPEDPPWTIEVLQ